ncbi:MAG: ABC transporter permease [Deltaproteobacteria bacterium]|nr:ABC transporter permease [Deltaproteobacteria bacterium]
MRLPYELFLGWRYLYRGRGGRVGWLDFFLVLFFALAFFGLLGPSGLLFTSPRAFWAIALLVTGIAIAARLLLALFNTFTAISVLGIAIGVAKLLWVLSVTSGFQDEFRQKVLGVNAHILILKYGIDFSEYRRVIRTAEGTPGVAAAAPFLFNEMMVARGNRLSGVLVKGVDPQLVGRVLDLPRHIDQPKRVAGGDLSALLTPSTDDRGRTLPQLPGIVIGRELAAKLDAKVGDVLRLISPLSGLDTSSWSADTELPRSRDFRVAAIFYSGFDEYDRRLVYLHMREVQSFFDQGDVVTGVELKIHDVQRARPLARQLARALGGSPYRTVDWSELNQNLFTALGIQKLFLEIVIGFIVVVAAFNVLAALAMLVIRKTREIAILKSMGLSSAGIARIFVAAGLVVWVAGTSLGLAWGYLGGLALRRYGFPLDPKVYLINELPVRMNPMEFVVTAAFALGVCLLATLYPAVRAARLNPVEGLRYQ